MYTALQWASLMAQRVKNLPAMQDTQEIWVQSSLVWKIPWRRKWQSTPVFWPEKSHRQRSLAGYNPKGCKESDTTEHTHTHIHTYIYTHFNKTALYKEEQQEDFFVRGGGDHTSSLSGFFLPFCSNGFPLMLISQSFYLPSLVP